jgi:HlyD family secretion protein
MKKRSMCVVALALLAFGGCEKKAPAPQEETYVVGPATLRDIISQTGEVAPVVKVDLKCEASGTIEKLYVKEGQPLQKGDQILIIDPTRLRTSKEKLDLQIEQASIERQQSERAYKRGQELASVGTVSQRELEELKNSLDLKDIAYRQRVIERRDIAEQLAKTTVLAPMTGILTSLDVQEGEIAVSATSGMQAGTTIGTIADVTNLEVITQIGEADYTRLSKGQSVIIKPEAVEGAQTRGTISFISLAAKKKGNDELGTFEVRISVDSLIAGIVPGVNVHVEFVVLEKEVPMAVPYQYVQKQNGSYSVQVRRAPGKGGMGGPRGEGRPHMGEGGPRPDSGGGTAVQPAGQGRQGERGQRGQWAGRDGKGKGRGKAPGGKQGKSRTKEIEVGDTDYRNYEVVSGLSVGDTVVYTPPQAEDEDRTRAPGGMGGGGGRR